MFVVLEVKDGICYFEFAEIDKYTDVSVVSIKKLAHSSQTISETQEETSNLKSDEQEDIDSEI